MTEILHRQIDSRAVGRARLFAPVRLPDTDRPQARLFLHWPDGVPADDSAPAIMSSRQTVLRHLPQASIADIASVANAQRLSLRVEGARISVPLVDAEWDRFRDLDVMVGHRNGESMQTVLDWLAWHVRHHRAQAALIVDRGHPDETAHMVALLAGHVACDTRLADLRRVVVVGFLHPLGITGEGPEAHPLHAADAPGKDRMDALPADPWASRLGFSAVFELLRARFLGAARAVMRVELMDMVRPGDDGATVFDAVARSPRGMLPLAGTRTYPWALRQTEAAQGDHICLRFDAPEPTERGWCVSPARLPGQTRWMPFRVLGAKAPGRPAWPFWRCMALRHGAGKVSQIVARTALAEDPALLEMSASLNHVAERMPHVDAFPTDQLPARSVRGQRTAIVTTMKNEGPFILEWLAYHRAIGVTDFLIYTNDCSDGTDRFLQLLARKGLVAWRDNPYRATEMKPQHAALDAANSEGIVRDADWVICMDVDEFIAVHVGDHTLQALYDAVPGSNLISLTWRLFGNADIHEFRDDFVIRQFDRAARPGASKPHQAWGFKTLFKNVGLFRKLGVHRPKGLRPHAHAQVSWVNGSGRPLPRDQWRNAWRSSAQTVGYDLASLNHYAVRSADSFLVKRDRGRVNHVDRDQGIGYWFRMNHNVVRDDRMQQILPLVQVEYDRLMADPQIASAHRACVAAHQARIAELKDQPDHAAFHKELTGARLERLSRLHGHFGSNVYLAGPAVIPDDMLDRRAENEFFFTVDQVDETQH